MMISKDLCSATGGITCLGMNICRILIKNLRDGTKKFLEIFSPVRKSYFQLESISVQMTYAYDQFLEAHQHEIWKQYEEVLGQEEIPWFQKSRSKWLGFGDRNSKYFHGIIAVRRRRNKIDTIQDEDGNWISNKEDVEHYVSM